MIEEKLQIKKLWTIRKYADDAAYQADRPYEVSEFEGNLLLNEGIAVLLDLLIGAGTPTNFGNANAYLGVGDGGPTALTGALSFPGGSAAVTGSGTAFTTELAAGDHIYLDSQPGVLATVQSIESNTGLTLTAVYAGSTGSGASSKILRAIATQTALQAATNKLYKAMEATFPIRASQTVTWRIVCGSTDANFAWNEFTVANGNSDAADNLNRKVSAQGTKAAGQTWTLDLSLTLS